MMTNCFIVIWTDSASTVAVSLQLTTVFIILPPIQQMELEALCFGVVCPSVCVGTYVHA